MKYDKDDYLKYYIVSMKNEDGSKDIVAWTDNKKLAQVYMDFHNCKKYSLKVMEGTLKELSKLVEENLHDEIRMVNIMTRKKNLRKYEDEVEYITVPVTELQMISLRDESARFLYTFINYSIMNNAMMYLRGKYKRALEDIYLQDIINYTINGIPSNISNVVRFDELLILVRLFPEHFGF